jgi:cysteine desulfurase
LRRNGHPEKVLPNTLSLSFKGLEANRILEEIGLEIAASAGAACHSDLVEISHVLLAMGLPKHWAKGTIRFSTGKITSDAILKKPSASPWKR